MSKKGDMASTTSNSQTSYVDFTTLLSPTFSATCYANSLVAATNNSTDTSLDLSTPLSRVLFDIQEIDTRIHTLTTQSALPILEFTQTQNAAAQGVLQGVEEELSRLNESYQRLEREVLDRYAEAEEARKGAERTWEVLRLGRAVGRIVGMARQVEGLVVESSLGIVGKEDHRGLVRATYALLAFRGLMNGGEGGGLARVHVVKSLRNEVFSPYEDRIKSRAQQTIQQFSMSTLSGNASSQGSVTFAQTEEAKARTTSAVTILYLLSSTPSTTTRLAVAGFQPELLLRTLQHYLQTALISSSASIGRSLRELPTLERTLLEVSARCQNIVALESLLATIKPPAHPLLADAAAEEGSNAQLNLLQPLLHYLDTASLPSYFWRTLASTLPPRVQDIIRAGGVSVRTLRSNRDRVRDEIRQCVLQGSQMPSGVVGRRGSQVAGNWEREAAVMVSSVTGALGK